MSQENVALVLGLPFYSRGMDLVQLLRDAELTAETTREIAPCSTRTSSPPFMACPVRAGQPTLALTA
jgi:hypothetical protein